MEFDFPDLYGPIAIDTENHDPYLKEKGSGWAYKRTDPNAGKVIGIAICCDNVNTYLPIGHLEGNLDPSKVKSYLNHQFTRDPSQPKIFFNAIYDLGWLKVEGIEVSGKIEDVSFQCPLVDENRLTYELDRIGKDYLGFGKDETALKEAGQKLGIKNTKKDNVKAHLMKIHPDIVGIYAKQDAKLTRDLWKHFNVLIEEQELREVYELELSLIPMFLEMRLRGVRVDVARAELRQKELLEEEKRARDLIKTLSGKTLGSWDSAEEIGVILDVLGIPYARTEKTKAPSITQGFLKSLEHPIGSAVLNGRKASNMRNTFIESAILNLQSGGRIYPNFNQLKKSDDQSDGVVGKEVKSGTKGTLSGRLSSSGPNFQQIPSPEKDDPNADFQFGMMVRELILPEEGELFHGLDYSSQEPRGIVHFAELTGCRKASEIGDQYRNDPTTDFHIVVRDMIRKLIPDFERKPAKIIGLGLAYGMGGGKLAYQLGLPYYESVWHKDGRDIEILKPGEEALELLRVFDEAVPFVKQLADKCKERVKKNGFIKTPTGRRFRFPLDNNGKYMYLNKALNRLIQGTSACMTKLALRNLYAEGILPLGTVHDEIDISSADPKVVRRAREIMQTALPMTVPILVDTGTGRNWGEASHPKLGSANYQLFEQNGGL